MGKPKHRQTVYTIVRTQLSDHPADAVMVRPVVLGVYMYLEEAEETKGKYEQEMQDKGLFDFFEFEVQAATYYSE